MFLIAIRKPFGGTPLINFTKIEFAWIHRLPDKETADISRTSYASANPVT